MNTRPLPHSIGFCLNTILLPLSSTHDGLLASFTSETPSGDDQCAQYEVSPVRFDAAMQLTSHRARGAIDIALRGRMRVHTTRREQRGWAM
jgi:hypothetical protein